MTDLRALLGDKYDDVMQAACGCDGTRVPHCFECSDSTWDHECPGPVPCAHRAAGAVLARVLPDLLADAWDEGHADGLHNAHEYREHRKLRNPYRPETATRDATDAPVTLAAPDAINPPPDPSAAVTEPHSPERTTQ